MSDHNVARNYRQTSARRRRTSRGQQHVKVVNRQPNVSLDDRVTRSSETNPLVEWISDGLEQSLAGTAEDSRVDESQYRRSEVQRVLTEIAVPWFAERAVLLGASVAAVAWRQLRSRRAAKPQRRTEDTPVGAALADTTLDSTHQREPNGSTSSGTRPSDPPRGTPPSDPPRGDPRMVRVTTVAESALSVTVSVSVEVPRAVLVDTPFLVKLWAEKLFSQAPSAPVDAVTIVDTGSFEALTVLRHRLAPSDKALSAGATVELKAHDRADLPVERRITVHFLSEGELVGVHQGSVLVAQSGDVLQSFMAQEPNRDVGAVHTELTSLDDPVDLTLVIERADIAGRYLWSAYSRDNSLEPLPSAVRSGELGPATASFATDNRRTIDACDDPQALFSWLVGRGVGIADAIPVSVRDVLVRLIEQPHSARPPTVLLLTAEVDVPWELAVLTTTETSGVERRVHGLGDSSPFLGSHVAIARWPLTSNPLRFAPPSTLDVSRHAVIAESYNAVPGWWELPAAEAEADELASTYQPAQRVRPRFSDLKGLLEGDPPAEVLHLALHGQFDPASTEEGLVLLRETGDGQRAPQYLRPDHVKGVLMPRHPFVFLNACQTGAGKQVLGDYGGLAAAFIRSGASAVVAPLWNLDDEVARSVAREFYGSVYSGNGVGAAEALRRIRARYAFDRFADGEWAPSPTYLAYQLFGHPRLRLIRTNTSTSGASVVPNGRNEEDAVASDSA
jgi:hypothetical protein